MNLNSLEWIKVREYAQAEINKNTRALIETRDEAVSNVYRGRIQALEDLIKEFQPKKSVSLPAQTSEFREY